MIITMTTKIETMMKMMKMMKTIVLQTTTTVIMPAISTSITHQMLSVIITK